MSRAEDLYYYNGEKPPALTVEYRDDDGDLLTSIAGATLSAKTSIDGASEVSVGATNNGDGTLTIDWPRDPSASVFVLASGVETGIMRIDIEVDDGSGPWYLPRFSLPIKRRT
jgi:hypothetical protein